MRILSDERFDHHPYLFGLFYGDVQTYNVAHILNTYLYIVLGVSPYLNSILCNAIFVRQCQRNDATFKFYFYMYHVYVTMKKSFQCISETKAT